MPTLARHAGSRRPLHLRRVAAGLATGTLALGSLVALSAVAVPAASAAGPAGLPKIVDGQVLAFATMGDKVVVGGTFTTLQLPNGTTVKQPRLFAYDLVTGTFDASFRPTVDKTVTALVGRPDGTGVYVGGAFNTVDGVTRRKLAKLDADGSVDLGFIANASSKVGALSLLGNRLFVGGQFKTIHGVARQRLAEVDATTGAVAAGFNLPITGSAAPGGYTNVQALEVSPDGSKLLVAHNGLDIGGLERVGVGIVDISGPVATVTPWYTTLWKDALPANGGLVRVTDAQWGPTGTWFVTTNTGGDRPPTNDSVQRFDLGVPLPAQPTWVTRQFDTSYAVDIDSHGTVYVGGHFRYTEAPGSAEPWPGDSGTNYGYGPAGGAVVLGDQVVGRMQIAALNPTTGKALNWYSSANGLRGVLALKVVGNKLLIGHDGTVVDGQKTGRHGMADLYGAPYDTSRPHTQVVAPLLGAVLPPGTVTVSGTSTAPAGVKKVQAEVRNKAGKYLHTNGTWGSFYAFPATLDSAAASSTGWSLDVNLPDAGDYTLWLRSFGQDGSLEPAKQPVPITVHDVSNPPPSISWSYPVSNEQDFTGNTITVSGTATDPDGVHALSVVFLNKTENGYLMDDGTIGDYTSFPAVLASPDATTTTWSLTVTLPDGEYTASARATDTLGSGNVRGADKAFLMQPSAVPPGVTLAAPSDGQLVGSSFALSGTATDDTGVGRVLVKLTDSRFGQGPQIAGTIGAAAWIPATLASPGATTTGWSLSMGDLPYGTYTVSVYAEDEGGVVTPASARPSGTVHRWPAAATVEPDTTVTGPSTDTRFGSLSIPLTGTASYPGGVATVQLVVRDARAARYLQADGTVDRLPAFFAVPVASPGATSTTWSTALSLPYASTWRVDAIAVGSDGNIDGSFAGSRNTYYVYPGDADPTIELNSPASGATVSGTGGVITAGGRAFDDVGVSAVQILVKGDGSQGLRQDGTVGTAQWVTVFLTNPGGTFTNWNFTTPALPAGTWHVSARAVDSVGKAQLDYPTSTVTLVP